MENSIRKDHWNNIYQTKENNKVSWYQTIPETSLYFLKQSMININSKIIDVGGGNSFLVDSLIELGFKDITVLDISSIAINNARQRLGKKSEKIKWITTDILNFKTKEKYDFWHDRALFHFFTESDEINSYIEISQRYIKQGGSMIIGTFSENGPNKCSGINIKQYSEHTLSEQFKKYFSKIKCINVNHKTPLNTIQNFTFCSFEKK